MAGYAFGYPVWGWTSNGNHTCAQAGIKYEQVLDTHTQVRFRVSGCMRSGDGTRNHFNRYFYVNVYVQYRLDGKGDWINLGSSGEGSTDYDLSYNPPGLETPATGWLYTPVINRQNSTSSRKIEFRAYVPKGAFDSNAQAVLSTQIRPKTAYVVSYHPGDSTSAPPQQLKYHDVPLILTNDTPEILIGHTFRNWNTALDGSGTTYERGATYTRNAPVTMYAQYEPNEYHVYYYDNYDGAPEPFDQTVTYNENWSIKDGSQRNKYWFLNWNTKSDGTGATYSAGVDMGQYTITADSAYYAQWTPAEYPIKYNKNADTTVNGMPKNQTKTSGQPIDLADNVPTRAGYDFLHWASTAQGETPTYNPGVTYTKDQALNLYATWSAAYCKVIYDGNATYDESVPEEERYNVDSESMPSSNIDVQRDLKWTIENKTPKRLYHTFEGWYTNSAATGTAYYPGEAGPIVTTATTFYAKWSRDQYSVTYYNKDSNISVPETVTQSCGDPVTIATATEASRATVTQSYAARFVVTADVNGVIVGSFESGGTAPINLWGYNYTTYDLNSWNTRMDGTGVTYTPGVQYTGTEKNSNLLLYAQWNINPPSAFPTIDSPDYDNIKVATITSKDEKGNEFESYVFKGWYRKGNLIPTITPEATSFTFNDDYKYTTGTPTTLYAKWIPTTYTVTYTNASTPSNATIKNMPTSLTYRLNENYSIPESIPIWQNDQTETLKDYSVVYNYQYNNIVYRETVGRRVEFKGWVNTKDKGDPPTLYQKGETYAPLTTIAGESLILIANWGKPIDASELHIPAERKGYSFDGWFKDPNYTDPPTLNEDGLLLPAEKRTDIVLYAKWVPWIYRITYAGLSHDVQEWPYDAAEINITEEIPIQSPTTNTYDVYYRDDRTTPINHFEVTKTYSFNNWKIVEDSDNGIYTPNQDIKSVFNGVDKARELWDESGIFKGYLLNLEPNWDITSIVPTLSFPSSDSIEDFAGWEIYSIRWDAQNERHEEKIATIDKDITEFTPPDDCSIAIYPITKSKTWSVTYDANGGYFDNNETIIIDSNSPQTIGNYTPQKSSSSSTYTITIHNERNISNPKQEIIITPTYTYSFDGWKDKNGTTYDNQSTINGNITLYAQWEKTLVDGTSETVKWATSPWEGYTFGGWYSDFRFITLISSDFSVDNYKPTKDTDIYAKWTVEKYQINYDVNGGRDRTRPGTQTKSYNEDITISNIIPTYSDHIFKGWRGELKSATNGIEDENAPLDNIKIGKINSDFAQIQAFYALSNSNTIAPEDDDWGTTKLEPTDNEPYLWGKIGIIWPDNNSSMVYTTPMYIGQQYHWEKTEEYGTLLRPGSGETPHPEYILDWTTKRPESWSENFDLYERITITWVTDLIQPKDVYSWNRDIILIAQWRKVETLTEWLSYWETTPASENEPGNELTLKVENGTETTYTDSSQLLNAVYKINNTDTYVYGQGYKLRLSLINPYGDINPETGKTQRLTRTVFVPAKATKDSKTGETTYSGYYELPPGVKVAEISAYDGAQISLSYQAHMNLDYIDVNMPDFYEITEQIAGQINRLQVPNQNITAMLKSKYYAKDANETTTYEHSLDSWSIYAIEGPQGVEFEISTVNNPTLTLYQLDSKGRLFIKNSPEEYLDLDEQINQCIFKGILNENDEYIVTSDVTNGLIINYRATIAQRVYI